MGKRATLRCERCQHDIAPGKWARHEAWHVNEDAKRAELQGLGRAIGELRLQIAGLRAFSALRYVARDWPHMAN